MIVLTGDSIGKMSYAIKHRVDTKHAPASMMKVGKHLVISPVTHDPRKSQKRTLVYLRRPMHMNFKHPNSIYLWIQSLSLAVL